MARGTTAPIQASDRLSYLWLGVATALLFFAGGRWNVPLAAWLAPAFLLRFVRTQRLIPGFLLAWLVRSVVAGIVTQGTILYPGAAPYAIVALVSLLTTLPFLTDRLVAPRVGGFLSTLIFPTAYVSVEYLSSFGPLGSWNSLAYTQYGDLPLLQLASAVGIWGISFLIAWLAATVNWVWDKGFAWREVRVGVLIDSAVYMAVMLAGGARLSLFPPESTLVRVAGISALRAAVAAFSKQLPSETVSALASGKASTSDRSAASAAFTIVDGDLFARSQQEARAGAKIVVWPEASPTGASVLEEDEPGLVKQAGALARQEGIYLDMGLAVYLRSANGPAVKDEAVLLDPAGDVVWTYEKSHPAPGEQGTVVIGDGKLPSVASPYGRLANAICYDLDFPTAIRPVGQAGADLMLAPSDDWQAVDPVHTQHAVFRAVEDGFSLVRPSSNGLSIAVDDEGRVLSQSDYFSTDEQVIVANVPIRGVRTIYAGIGDLFAWLCVIGLATLSSLAIVRGRTRQSAQAGGTISAAQPTS